MTENVEIPPSGWTMNWTVPPQPRDTIRKALRFIRDKMIEEATNPPRYEIDYDVYIRAFQLQLWKLREDSLKEMFAKRFDLHSQDEIVEFSNRHTMEWRSENRSADSGVTRDLIERFIIDGLCYGYMTISLKDLKYTAGWTHCEPHEPKTEG